MKVLLATMAGHSSVLFDGIGSKVFKEGSMEVCAGEEALLE